MRYRKGFKNQLYEDEVTKVNIFIGTTIVSRRIILAPDGVLTIKAGYAWDGASGPTWDTKTCLRGSLVHDALYQLMREELLPTTHRKQVDYELYRILREDGMWYVRAKTWLKMVDLFGKANASPESRRKIYTAP